MLVFFNEFNKFLGDMNKYNNSNNNSNMYYYIYNSIAINNYAKLEEKVHVPNLSIAISSFV